MRIDVALRVLLVLLAWSALTPSARAELAWVRGDGAESCAAPEDLAARVVAHGVDPRVLGAQRVEGLVTRTETGFSAPLRVVESDGTLGPTRTVESQGADCAQLTPSLVLVITMLVGESAKPPALAPRWPARDPRFERFEPAVQASTTIGLLARPTLGFTTSFRFTTQSRLGGLFGISQAYMLHSDRYEQRGSKYALLQSMVSAHARVCVDALRAERFIVVPCAGFEVGLINTEIGGRYTYLDDSRNDVFVTALLGVRLAWRVTGGLRVLLDLHMGGLLKGPVFRQDFYDMGLQHDDAYRAQRFQFYPSLGVTRAF